MLILSILDGHDQDEILNDLNKIEEILNDPLIKLPRSYNDEIHSLKLMECYLHGYYRIFINKPLELMKVYEKYKDYIH